MCGRLTLRRLVGLALVIGALGCGSVKRYKVEGTVLLDGQPVDGATVTFLPEDDKTGQPATAMTDKSGNFKLSTNNVDGAFAGNYKVTITKNKAVESSGPPPTPGGPVDMTKGYLEMMQKRGGTAGGQPGGGGPAPPKSELPVKYAESATSGFTCKVPTDGPIKFDLHK